MELYSVCMLSPMIHRRLNGHSESEDQVEVCVYSVLHTEYTLGGTPSGGVAVSKTSDATVEQSHP